MSILLDILLVLPKECNLRVIDLLAFQSSIGILLSGIDTHDTAL